jgi:hypothetical protein
MQYNSTNLITSLTLDLAAFLRSKGYAVYWHTTGDTEAALQEPTLATITFLPAIPANPTPFVRLKSESGNSDEIVVPALALTNWSQPRRRRELGLGHRDWEWEVDFTIDAFAADEFQHRALADCVQEWLQREVEQEIPIFDHAANPTNPSLMEPVRVRLSDVRREELYMENIAVRYYVRGDFTVQFVE